jgi:hypothetical protein
VRESRRRGRASLVGDSAITTEGEIMLSKVWLRLPVALSAVSLLACFAISGAALAGGGNSGSAKVCQKGGWASANLQDGSGNSVTFASQDECVSFGADNGGVFDPSLVGDPSHVVENQESFFVASGFHPSSLGSLTIHVLGGLDGSITLPAMTTATGGLPAGVGTVFTAGACADGVTGADVTLVDGFGVHASTTIFLDCP